MVEGGVARRAVEKDDTPKYEPTIYNYKCREDSSSRSPTPSPPAIKEEPVLENFGKDVTSNAHYSSKSPHGDGEHSDNCSEMSDEGYRSLGAVQPPSGNGNPGTCTQGSPTVADCQSERCLSCIFFFFPIFLFSFSFFVAPSRGDLIRSFGPFRGLIYGQRALRGLLDGSYVNIAL